MISMTIRLERDDTLPAFGAFLRCDCADSQCKPVVLLNVSAVMAPALEAEDGTMVEQTRDDRKRLLVSTLMHEFGHVLEAHLKLPVNEQAIEAVCEQWEAMEGAR